MREGVPERAVGWWGWQQCGGAPRRLRGTRRDFADNMVCPAYVALCLCAAWTKHRAAAATRRR